jgi:hypothetical protein
MIVVGLVLTPYENFGLVHMLHFFEVNGIPLVTHLLSDLLLSQKLS